MGLETQPINRRTGRNATQAGRRRLFDEVSPGREPGGSSGAAKAASAGSRGRKPMETQLHSAAVSRRLSRSLSI